MFLASFPCTTIILIALLYHISNLYGSAGLNQRFLSSKSGENFNHEAEWSCLDKHITENHPYNYYPRGRVEIKNKKVTIYINPDINKERILCKVVDAFELMVTDELKCIKIKSDGSNHYRYTCDAV